MRRAFFFGRALLAVGLSAAVFAASAEAQSTYFGEDLDGGTNTRASLTHSMAAESMFLSFLTGVGTETFDSYSVGTSTPLNLDFPGAGTATLNGSGSIDSAPAGGTNGFGRYGVSDPNFWEVTVGGPTQFVIDFTNPIAAFGFYGIDVGDFGGQMSLSFMNGGGSVPVSVPHTVGSSGNPDGAAFYFGYIDVANPFTSVAFNFDDPTGGVDADVFAFDDMTIGSVEQVPVPEPSSMLLLAGGLLGVLGVSRRRNRGDSAA